MNVNPSWADQLSAIIESASWLEWVYKNSSRSSAFRSNVRSVGRLGLDIFVMFVPCHLPTDACRYRLSLIGELNPVATAENHS